jgi:hypothetical protein
MGLQDATVIGLVAAQLSSGIAGEQPKDFVEEFGGDNIEHLVEMQKEKEERDDEIEAESDAENEPKAGDGSGDTPDGIEYPDGWEYSEEPYVYDASTGELENPSEDAIEGGENLEAEPEDEADLEGVDASEDEGNPESPLKSDDTKTPEPPDAPENPNDGNEPSESDPVVDSLDRIDAIGEQSAADYEAFENGEQNQFSPGQWESYNDIVDPNETETSSESGSAESTDKAVKSDGTDDFNDIKEPGAETTHGEFADKQAEFEKSVESGNAHGEPPPPPPEPPEIR